MSNLYNVGTYDSIIFKMHSLICYYVVGGSPSYSSISIPSLEEREVATPPHAISFLWIVPRQEAGRLAPFGSLLRVEIYVID